MSEDMGYLSLPLELQQELERYANCDHDWQPAVTERRWLRGHPHEMCSKCKTIRMERLPRDGGGDENQDPVRNDP